VLFLFAVLERVLFSGDVMPGIEVDGADVEGMSELDAYNEISELAAELETEPVSAVAGDVELVFAPGEIDFDVDEAATVRAARTAGRSHNPVEQTAGAVLRRFRTETVPLVVTWNQRRLEAVVDLWARELEEGVREPSLTFEGTDVIEVDGRSGTGIDHDRTLDLVEDALRTASRPSVELEVETVAPRLGADDLAQAAARATDLLAEDIVIVANGESLVLTPDRLATALRTRPRREQLALTIDPDALVAALGDGFQRLTVPPVDATFAVDGSSVSVVPHTNGRGPDLPALIDAILDGRRRIDAPLVDLIPERTTAWAEGLHITELVSSFTTEFPAGQPRVENIAQAAEYIDGTIVPPGDTFSFNDTVGERSEERGFVNAPVYYQGFTEDIGGGVSQVATTLFNAVFYGGYEDVTHKPHSIYFSRYPRVIEATVNYPDLDLQFRNDTSAGVLIRAYAGSSSITIAFYGDDGGREVRLEGPKVLEEFPVTDELVEWPALPAGQQVLVESGYAGFSAEAYRVIEQPGAEPVRERFFWSYDMIPNKVLVGTAQPTTTVPPTTAPTTTAPPAGNTTTTAAKQGAATTAPPGG
jgi:vancomycin resistance protein YoaR